MVLIGIAVLLAVVFRDKAADLITTLFKSIKDKAKTTVTTDI